MLLKLTPAFSVEKPHKLPKLILKKNKKKTTYYTINTTNLNVMRLNFSRGFACC